jgi:hypothetical protein
MPTNKFVISKPKSSITKLPEQGNKKPILLMTSKNIMFICWVGMKTASHRIMPVKLCH